MTSLWAITDRDIPSTSGTTTVISEREACLKFFFIHGTIGRPTRYCTPSLICNTTIYDICSRWSLVRLCQLRWRPLCNVFFFSLGLGFSEMTIWRKKLPLPYGSWMFKHGCQYKCFALIKCFKMSMRNSSHVSPFMLKTVWRYKRFVSWVFWRWQWTVNSC